MDEQVVKARGSDVVPERLQRQAAVAIGKLQLFEAERAGGRLGNRGGDSGKSIVLALHLRPHFARIVFWRSMLDSNGESGRMSSTTMSIEV